MDTDRARGILKVGQLTKRLRQCSVGLLVVVALVPAVGCGRDATSAGDAVGPKVFADPALVFGSVALAFGPKYKAVQGFSEVHGSPGAFCDDEKHGSFKCDFREGLGVGELWTYLVAVDHKTGCWHASLTPRYGWFQSDIDSYVNRDTLAPSKSQVRGLIRRANTLRNLRGCLPSNVGRYVGRDPTKFIAALAKLDVLRAKPGTERSTVCAAKAKSPESNRYLFSCTTALVDGRRYEDQISCEDPPPYRSYDSCVEADSYPRVPPRALPSP